MIDINQVLDGTLGPTAGAAVTVSRVSTNTIDWLVGRDMGVDSILGIHCFVSQAFVGVGASLTVNAQVCDTVGGAYLNVLSTPAIPVAQLIAGAPLLRVAVPRNQLLNSVAGVLKAPGRFFQLNYTVTGGPFTQGAVFAHIAPDNDRQEFYPYPSNFVA